MILAYAKLNLGLRVFPARADGFHDLESWMVPISWHDTLRVELPEAGGGATEEAGISLAVTGRAEGVPVELEKNLVGRAALKLAAAVGTATGEDAGLAVGRAHITLHKVLPPGGGLGGGSSDAAAALVALNEAWGLHWDEPRLERLAAELGSDVPFFIRGMPSLCRGRGEIMTPLPLRESLFAALLIPPWGCPTKAVYQAFDAGRRHTPALPPTDWAALAAAPAEQLNGLLVNDLEPGAFFVAPQLAALRDRAAGIAGQRVHLTGSGSTLFTLCSNSVAAGDVQGRWAEELGEGCVSVAVRVERG